MINAGLFSSNRNDWETPKELYEELNNKYHFTLDPCSTDENAKCEYHFTIREDGLKQKWGGNRVYCNPPYGSEIGKWVEKAYKESKDAFICMLIPARTDTRYFHEYIYHKAEIIFLKGRLKFELNGESKQSAPFPSMIVLFGKENLEKKMYTNKIDEWNALIKEVEYLYEMLEEASIGNTSAINSDYAEQCKDELIEYFKEQIKKQEEKDEDR